MRNWWFSWWIHNISCSCFQRNFQGWSFLVWCKLFNPPTIWGICSRYLVVSSFKAADLTSPLKRLWNFQTSFICALSPFPFHINFLHSNCLLWNLYLIENRIISKGPSQNWIHNTREIYELHQRRQKQSKKDTIKPQTLKSPHSKKVPCIQTIIQTSKRMKIVDLSIPAGSAQKINSTSWCFHLTNFEFFFIPFSPAGQWL